MTDTGPPTQVDDVPVVGQRRRDPSEAFPTRPDPSELSPLEQGDDQIGGGDGDGPVDPCADPVAALPWNADAAAAASVADFLAAALNLGFADAPGGSPTLSNREFGRGLGMGPGSNVWGNAVSWGPPVTPGSSSSMTVDMTGITWLNYHGDIHSHPNGNQLPSQQDWNGFMYNNNQARLNGRTGDTFSLYIVVVDPNGGPLTIRVYQDGPRQANSPAPPRPTNVGQEVNPDAQPCS